MNFCLKCTQILESAPKMQYSRIIDECLLHGLKEATSKNDTWKFVSLPKPTQNISICTNTFACWCAFAAQAIWMFCTAAKNVMFNSRL